MKCSNSLILKFILSKYSQRRNWSEIKVVYGWESGRGGVHPNSEGQVQDKCDGEVVDGEVEKFVAVVNGYFRESEQNELLA